MAQALKPLPQADHPDLLVGYSAADDAGVFRISKDQALVQTLDFFPPIVDDPYAFGSIAAANALSDIYAMGGLPITALNIVGFPKATLPPELLTDLLRGGRDKVAEAGAVIVGGHSINDKELKYGLSVTGLIHPGRIISNAGAKPGDILFLTKRLGSGIISTAVKNGEVEQSLINEVINEMAKLNREASEAMLKHSAHSATDITGYGLVGHTFEMADASNVTIEIDSSSLPLLPRAIELAEKGFLTGGAKANREYLEQKISIGDNLSQSLIDIAFDPQTSGGLLIAIAPEIAELFADELRARKLFHHSIGRVLRKSTYSVILN